ncbi:MAG: GxxExxY protein [Bacteroidetes bacterium]|nr:MAG: GxxExxY protein [Bacteroidota bacterium]
MRVHRYFGPGFPEIVYKRALMIELRKLRLEYVSEMEREIYYDGQLIYKRRLDLIVNKGILIELKAVAGIDKACFAQIINYLRVFKMEVGLSLNFGSSSLQFKRFISTDRGLKD